MNKLRWQSVLAVVLCASVVNCAKSAKDVVNLSGLGGGGRKTDGGNVAAEQGLNGEYLSGCGAGPMGGYRTISLVSDKKDVTIETVEFGDDQCKGQAGTKESLKGQLSEVSTEGEIHTVKLNIPLGDGVSTWRYYRMKFTNEVIVISEFAMDPTDLKGIEPKVELKKVADGSAPGSDPAPKPAPVVSSKPLQSGDYTSIAGDAKVCPQNIGVGKQNGAVVSVYVTYMSPCDGSMANFDCSSTGVCTSGGTNDILTILNDDSYEYSNSAQNFTATFKRN